MDALEESLRTAGISPGSIRHILISHLHSDHTGLAQVLRERTGAAVWMHRADADFLRELKTSTEWHTKLELALRQSGVDVDTKAAALGAWSRLIASFALLEPDRFLEEGSSFDTALGPLMTLHTPGHSPGHCCFWAPEAEVLFSGDLVLEDATSHLAWQPGTDTVSCYLSSLERLGRLPATLILPGHGDPAPSAARVIKRDLRRRQTRLHAIEKMLTLENLAPAAVVRRLWPFTLKPIDFQMAFSEVMAFREHLALR
jgi:glyoxylase-like metal-dependent hydrolase (beta-lactamase superfamily II)